MNNAIPRRVREVVRRFPGVTPHLNGNARALLKTADDVAEINAIYHDAVTQAIIDYFENGGSVTAPSNAMRRAMTDAFNDASDAGWVDGGAELPIEGDALRFVNERTAEEYGHIAELFQDAKDKRKDKDFDYFTWASARANAYTSTVLAIYNACVLFAQKSKMLTWVLGDTEKHCKTCASLNGNEHRASWYIKYNYIPRKPDAAMDCHGYNCDCRLMDRDGNEVTL